MVIENRIAQNPIGAYPYDAGFQESGKATALEPVRGQCQTNANQTAKCAKRIASGGSVRANQLEPGCGIP
jgi:hypothetical protein